MRVLLLVALILFKGIINAQEVAELDSLFSWYNLTNNIMAYLIDGEVVDTYGGDYTYRYVWYEIEDGKYYFYEYYTGGKASDTERVTDPKEIAEFMREINCT